MLGEKHSGAVQFLGGSYSEWFITAALWPQRIIAAGDILPTIYSPINKMEMKDFIIAFHYCVPEVHTTNWDRNEFPQRCQPWVTSFVLDKDIPQSLYLFSFFPRRSGGALLQTYSWQVTQWQRMYLYFTGLARKIIYSHPQFLVYCVQLQLGNTVEPVCALNRVLNNTLTITFSAFL